MRTFLVSYSWANKTGSGFDNLRHKNPGPPKWTDVGLIEHYLNKMNGEGAKCVVLNIIELGADEDETDAG